MNPCSDAQANRNMAPTNKNTMSKIAITNATKPATTTTTTNIKFSIYISQTHKFCCESGAGISLNI